MSYSAEVSRTHPSCFLFLIDRSGSMDDSFGGDQGGKRKADGVADAINRLLQNLVIKCAKSEGVRDYYHVGVLGYGAEVGSAFQGALAGRELVPISEIADSPARVEERTRKVDDGAGGLADQVVKFPVWFEPVAQGGTPMCQALRSAQAILREWLAQHVDSFPPIVINITDGESTDGDPSVEASALRELETTDGKVLFLNVHLSSHAGAAIEFPGADTPLPDQYARLLFQLSSLLPAHLRFAAQQEGYAVTDSSRGFVFNGDVVSMIRFLDIGTRPSNLR